MLKFKEFLSISEAFNVPISSPEDVDGFDTKQDKNALKKLISHLVSLGLEDIPVAGGANKIKIRGAKNQDTQNEIRQWIKIL